MSHTITCKVNLTDEVALLAAAETLGLQSLGKREHRMFDGKRITGHGFKLSGWREPLVIQETTGQAFYDNYGEAWGKQIELDKLVQEYSLETIRRQAAENDMECREVILENGDVEVELEQIVTS